MGADKGLCRRSWERIRAYLGGLGGGSGPMWAVLGADQGEKWPWLEREGDLGRDLGRKVAQTRARRPFWGGDRFRMFPGPPDARTHFLIDM